MSRICAECGRGPKITISRSHSHIATKRWQAPNLQVKHLNGKKVRLCAKCIRGLTK